MNKPQEVVVRLKDVTIDGIPSVELNLEVDDSAKTLKEPTPAMWVGIYLAHILKNGQLMEDAQKFVREGQFISS